MTTAAQSKPAVRSAEALRAKEITLIHVLSGQIGLDEDTRRGMLAQLTGKRSSKDLTWQERKRVIDHLVSKGAKVTTPRKPGRKTGAPSRPLDTSAQASKVRALWIALHGLGAVRDPSEAALAGYTKRIAKVDALQWATGEQLETLIETLKKWVIRVCAELAPDLMSRANLSSLDEKTSHDLKVCYGRLLERRLSAEASQDLIDLLRRAPQSEL